MILVLLLIACRRDDDSVEACDTHPDALVVEDPDGVATPVGLDAAMAGLDAFRGWTERDAICVSSIRFHADIPRSDGFPEDFNPGGQYVSRTDEVQLEDHGGWTSLITTHELCHALDYTEELSERNVDVFDPATFDPAYPESIQLTEAFADACSAGPGSRVREALAAHCSLDGGEPDELDVFLREVVYTGVDSWDLPEVVPGALAVDWMEFPAPVNPPDETVYGVNATWNGVAGTTLDHVDGSGRLWILGLDGSVVVVADAGPLSAYVDPVPWNLGAAYPAWSETYGRVLYRDGTVAEAAGLTVDEHVELVWDEVVFVRGDEGLVGRDLWTGAAVDLGIDPEWMRLHGAYASADIVGDGVLVHADGEGWVGSPSGWTWTGSADAARASLGDLVLAQHGLSGEAGFVDFIVGVAPDGTLHTTADPCSPGVQGDLVSLDGTPWLLVNAQESPVRLGRVVLVP